MRYWLRIVGILFAAILFYYGCHRFREEIAVVHETELHYRFEELYKYLVEYYESHQKWPQTLAELPLPEERKEKLLIDFMSGKPYLYFPQAKGRYAILVAQPKPYRVGLWPFGELRRCVLMPDDGPVFIRFLEGEEALLSIPEAQKAIARRLGYKEKDE